jgi:Bacterial protein of unknown function (DUF899)
MPAARATCAPPPGVLRIGDGATRCARVVDSAGLRRTGDRRCAAGCPQQEHCVTRRHTTGWAVLPPVGHAMAGRGWGCPMSEVRAEGGGGPQRCSSACSHVSAWHRAVGVGGLKFQTRVRTRAPGCRSTRWSRLRVIGEAPRPVEVRPSSAPGAVGHPMRRDRRWAKRAAARSGGDGAGCRARPRHVRGRGGPSPLRRAPRLHQVSRRTGLERVLQVGVHQAHDLPRRSRLHARLRQAGDPRRHAATPARLSLSDPVLAKRAGRHLRQPTYVPPPPRRDPLLRDGVAPQLDATCVHLNHRDVTLTCFSRAPIDRLIAYKHRMGWQFPYVST